MRLTGVATVLLAAILCGACGGSPEPVNPADLRGEGTDLPDGLSVQAGSELVGPAIPTVLGDGTRADGWRAVLLLDGDPIEAWDRYLEHVRTALDLELPAAPSGAGCLGEEHGEAFGCSWSAHFAEFDGYVGLQLEAPRGDVTGRWQIVLDTYGLAVRPSGRVEDPMTFAEDVQPPAENPPAADRPEVGDLLSPDTMYPGERFTLREGSELVTQYGEGGATGGLQVLLAVTGDQVAMEYRQQCGTLFPAEYAEEEELPPVEFDGFTVTEYRYDVGAGAGTCAVTLFESSDRTYVTVERFAD